MYCFKPNCEYRFGLFTRFSISHHQSRSQRDDHVAFPCRTHGIIPSAIAGPVCCQTCARSSGAAMPLQQIPPAGIRYPSRIQPGLNLRAPLLFNHRRAAKGDLPAAAHRCRSRRPPASGKGRNRGTAFERINWQLRTGCAWHTQTTQRKADRRRCQH